MHPHLVRMHKAGDLDPADDVRLPGVADIDDRGAVGRTHMPDISVAALGDDLAATGDVELGEMLQYGHGRLPLIDPADASTGGLSVEPDRRQVLVDVMARADLPAFDIAAIGHDAVAP